MAAKAKESEKESEKDPEEEIFIEWTERDLMGNTFIVKPWPLTKSKRGLKIVGSILESISKTVGQEGLGFEGTLSEYFFNHTHHFFLNHVDNLCDLILLSVEGKKAEWLEHVDHALALRILDVIWQQNFTGPRVVAELNRWIVPITPSQGQSLEDLVQATNSLGDIS